MKLNLSRLGNEHFPVNYLAPPDRRRVFVEGQKLCALNHAWNKNFEEWNITAANQIEELLEVINAAPPTR